MDRTVRSDLSRRRFLAGAGAAAVVGTMTAAGVGAPAKAAHPHHHPHSDIPRGSAPKPIPQVVPTGLPPEAAPFDAIHWLLPGPPGAITPINGLEAFGLDVDPSTITDFRGHTAYAVVAGAAHGSDGATYDFEGDVRVMQGHYIGEDGEKHYGTFGFF